jgi:hypothetical protein
VNISNPLIVVYERLYTFSKLLLIGVLGESFNESVTSSFRSEDRDKGDSDDEDELFRKSLDSDFFGVLLCALSNGLLVPLDR